VLIRSRKPWTLCRRRLFGWNVRLLTGAPVRFGRLTWDKGGHSAHPGKMRCSRTTAVCPGREHFRTWLSLLTVRAICAQVKPDRADVKRARFPQRTRVRPPRLWKISVRRSSLIGRLPPRGPGDRIAAGIHTLWTNLWTTSCVQ
jgi:hypothetical protein